MYNFCVFELEFLDHIKNSNKGLVLFEQRIKFKIYYTFFFYYY